MQGYQWPYTPRTGVGISGYGWLDNMYRLIRYGGNQPTDHNTKLFQQGRFLLRITPTYTNGNWFVQAQGEIVANKDQYVVNATNTESINADDVWVRTGVWNKWDITVGRMQAFDVYPLGMGLDLNSDERAGAFDGTNTPPPLYAVDYLLYRPAGPGDVALHLYPLRFLRFEALAQYGNGTRGNYLGGRPAVIFEHRLAQDQGRARVSLQLRPEPDPAGHRKASWRRRLRAARPRALGGARYQRGVCSRRRGEPPRKSGAVGEHIRLRWVRRRYSSPKPPRSHDRGGRELHELSRSQRQRQYRQLREATNLQTYVAIQYLFYRQLFVKLVGSYAKSHFANETALTPYDDDMLSVRLRVMYLY